MGAPQYEQAGADIGGTGTTNTIPRWTGPSTLGDSGLIDDGAQVYTTTRNLAIGTTSAGGVKARVTGGAAGNWTAWFTGSSTVGQSYGLLLDGGTNASDTALQIRSAGGSTLMFVRGDGNVSIGTATPSAKLDVVGAPNTVGAAISTTYGTATTVYSAFRFNNTGLAYGNSEIRNYVDGSASLGSNLALFTSQVGTGTLTERVRIDQSGNVGIGTASPYTRTESSTARTTALTSIAAFASMPLTVTDTTAFATGVGGGINFRGQLTSSSYTNFAAIWAARETAINSDYRGSLILATADNAGGYPVERARIDSAGNIILNTATTGATIQAAGTSQGLKLQGTGGTNNTDPNVLDFYADGGTANSGGVTWTPVLKFGGNTTGITYNTQMGRYTRIGNMVFATCYVRLTNKGSATGAATIDGLPTSANLAGLYAAGTIGFISAITSTGTMEAYITPNSSQITLRQVDIAGTNAATTDVNFANTSEIIISIAYSVN